MPHTVISLIQYPLNKALKHGLSQAVLQVLLEDLQLLDELPMVLVMT